MDFSKIRIAFTALVVGLVLGAGTFALFILHNDSPRGGNGGSVVVPSALEARIVTEQGDATTILISSDGRIAETIEESIDPEELRGALDALA